MKTTINKYRNFILAIGLMLMGFSTTAQTRYILNGKPELKVSGTSTIHDWDMIASTAKGNAVFIMEDNTLKEIQMLQVTMNAEALKSGKGQMDNNAYKALNTKAHPEIKFELKDIKKPVTENMVATGYLTIAGVRKLVTIKGKYNQQNGNINFTGNTNIKFTEFKIDPPTAVMGTIKTGDDLKITFNLNFTTQPSL